MVPPTPFPLRRHETKGDFNSQRQSLYLYLAPLGDLGVWGFYQLSFKTYQRISETYQRINGRNNFWAVSKVCIRNKNKAPRQPCKHLLTYQTRQPPRAKRLPQQGFLQGFGVKGAFVCSTGTCFYPKYSFPRSTCWCTTFIQTYGRSTPTCTGFVQTYGCGTPTCTAFVQTYGHNTPTRTAFVQTYAHGTPTRTASVQKSL